jgi:hypothetical protein
VRAVEGLFLQRNSGALVALARKDTDVSLKREIVERLTQLPNDRLALEYLRELLK